jgi:hypothetical protein
MARLSKRLRQSRCHARTINRNSQLKYRCLNKWQSTVDYFNSEDLKNPQRKTRTIDENKIVLLSVKMVLTMLLQQVTDGHMIIHDLNWKMIDKYAAENPHLQRGYFGQLRKSWFEDGDIMISGCNGNVESPIKDDELDDDDDDDDEEEVGSSKLKLTHVELQSMIKKIDSVHAEGETVTRNKLRCFLKKLVSASQQSPVI